MYEGYAKILKAYNFALATDLWGDIPYSKALQGNQATPIIRSRFDKQKDIYKGNKSLEIQSLFDLMREGLADLNEPTMLRPGADDLIYLRRQDSVADIPVSVPNQEFFERFPIVTASVKNTPSPGIIGPFTIILEIPADKGKIREITKITTGTAGLANLQGAESLGLNYDATAKVLVPIAGNGSNRVTFSSSLDRYTAYRTRVGAGAAGQPAVVAPNSSFTAQNPNQLPYYFLLTLEDGRQIVSTAVRVRVVE